MEWLAKGENKKRFLSLNNELLIKTATKSTGTTGKLGGASTLKSAVAHGDNYDCNSVSAGEDNAGQIMLAIMSFRKLKEEYPDYKGGLLLIDEVDAGLFPAAQKKLIDILDRECKDLKLQVIMTSHSTVLLEKIYEESQNPIKRSRFKTIYLTDSYGRIGIQSNWDWPKIYADINVQTVATGDIKLPKINIYFEDKEGEAFFKAIMKRQPVNKFLNIISEVSLGCSNYINLIKKGKVPEFKDKSIVCLDADAKKASEGLDSIILLPGSLPPDQLIFEFLYNLPASDNIWENGIQFTRSVFCRITDYVRSSFSITDAADLSRQIKAYTGTDKPRELFKKFYNDPEFQKFLKQPKQFNPWSHWVANNKTLCDAFIAKFIVRIKYVMKNTYGVSEVTLTFIDK